MKKQRTIFITGATGFVGSNLAVGLLNQGYNLKLLVRGENAEERVDNLLCRLYRRPEEYNKVKNRCEVVNGDIAKKNLGVSAKQMRRLKQEVSAIFHCAASVSFKETEKGEIKKSNINGTKNLLEFMRRLNLRQLHYLSTAYVAGQKAGVIDERQAKGEQAFNNAYEESKFKAERLIRQFKKKYDIAVTIYRPAIIVGDARTGKTSNFGGFYSYVRSLYLLVQIFKKDLQGSGKKSKSAGAYYKGDLLHMPLRVSGLPNKTINLLPINYVVDVIITIFKSRSSRNKIYHITNPDPPTLERAQSLISDSLGISGVRIVYPAEFRTDPMNRWEEFFAKAIKSFTPYFQIEEAVFVNRNTKKLLNDTRIKCPNITKSLIARLISYCVNTAWGKNIK